MTTAGQPGRTPAAAASGSTIQASSTAAGGSPDPEVSQEIVLAGTGDIEVLAGVIADAFFPLDPSRWLVGDGAARRGILKDYFGWQLEQAITGGAVHTTPDRTAAALWIPVGPEPQGPSAEHSARLAAITGRWLDRFVILEREFGRAHLTGVAHQHLAVLAVCPGHQSQGTGTRLLEFMHGVLDRADKPAYLVAANPRTRQVYRRHHGYADYGEPISLPGGPESGGPHMYPMVRMPGHGLGSPADGASGE